MGHVGTALCILCHVSPGTQSVLFHHRVSRFLCLDDNRAKKQRRDEQQSLGILVTQIHCDYGCLSLKSVKSLSRVHGLLYVFVMHTNRGVYVYTDIVSTLHH